MAYDLFKPEKYGMVYCHECHGSGKSAGGKGPCQKCGGFGLLIRNENPCSTIVWENSARLRRKEVSSEEGRLE